jgi:hypothetical protein
MEDEDLDEECVGPLVIQRVAGLLQEAKDWARRPGLNPMLGRTLIRTVLSELAAGRDPVTAASSGRALRE